MNAPIHTSAVNIAVKQTAAIRHSPISAMASSTSTPTPSTGSIVNTSSTRRRALATKDERPPKRSRMFHEPASIDTSGTDARCGPVVKGSCDNQPTQRHHHRHRQQQQQQPNHSLVSLLASMGMSNFRHNEMSAAKRYFSQALAMAIATIKDSGAACDIGASIKPNTIVSSIGGIHFSTLTCDRCELPPAPSSNTQDGAHLANQFTVHHDHVHHEQATRKQHGSTGPQHLCVRGMSPLIERSAAGHLVRPQFPTVPVSPNEPGGKTGHEVAPPTDTSSSQSRQASRKHIFDEGMWKYRNALPLDFIGKAPRAEAEAPPHRINQRKEHPTPMIAVLQYNIAMTCARSGDFSAALQLFQTALVSLADIHGDSILSDRASKTTQGAQMSDASDRKHSDADGRCGEAHGPQTNGRYRLSAHRQELVHFCAMALHNIANCHYRLGCNRIAYECYKESLSLLTGFTSKTGNRGETQASCRMSHNHHLAIALNCTACVSFHLSLPGQTDCILEMLRQSYQLYHQNRFHDDEHATSDASTWAVSAATVLNNMGRVQFSTGDFNLSLSTYQKALELRLEALGRNSIDAAATMYNTGQCYHHLKQYDLAMKHYRMFLDIATKVLGECSEDIAMVHKRMAEVHLEHGRRSDALACLQRAHESAQRALGDHHPEVASLLNRLGNLSYELHDFRSAMKYYCAGYRIEIEVLEPNHPHIIITLTNIAHIHKDWGNHEAALKAYQSVYSMQLASFGMNNIAAAGTLSSMGLIQYHMKDYPSSFDSYQEALRIRRDHYGTDDHADIASTLNSVGLVLFKQEFHDLAKACFLESLRIRKALLGPNHKDVAILWYNIATIYFETGQDDLAIEAYKETLRVEQASLGEDHPDVVLTMQHLGQVHQQLGCLEQALRYYSDALRTERRRPKPNDATIAKILNLLGNCHLQQGHVKEMMGCYSEASRIYESLFVSNPSRRTVGETLIIAGYNFYGISRIHPPAAPVA